MQEIKNKGWDINYNGKTVENIYGQEFEVNFEESDGFFSLGGYIDPVVAGLVTSFIIGEISPGAFPSI